MFLLIEWAFLAEFRDTAPLMACCYYDNILSCSKGGKQYPMDKYLPTE